MERLLEMKMTMPEIGEGKRFDRLNEYLDRTIEEVEQAVAELPDKDTQG